MPLSQIHAWLQTVFPAVSWLHFCHLGSFSSWILEVGHRKAIAALTSIHKARDQAYQSFIKWCP